MSSLFMETGFIQKPKFSVFKTYVHGSHLNPSVGDLSSLTSFGVLPEFIVD